MELGNKAATLECFNRISAQMLRQMASYRLDVTDGSKNAASDPQYSAIVTLTAIEALKLAVADSLYNFGTMLESFMGSLGEAERESVDKMLFVLDELRKNQAAINTIHDSYQARLKSLSNPKDTKGHLDVDLSPLSINDTIIIVQSFSLFNTSLWKMFPDEYSAFTANLLRRDQEMANLDVKAIIGAIEGKTRKLKALGMTISDDEMAKLGRIRPA